MQAARVRAFILGAPRDPLNPDTRKSVALIAFFAWIGLGADGLSSSCYGPEETYLALAPYTGLGFYLTLATVITVFIIAVAYNQVIELFPSGGGGYKVATKLIGPYAGLVSGAALIVDYVLTIAISVASGVDALFSLLPLGVHHFKTITGVVAILLLILLNLRGMKEAIKFLLPIFLGFVITHVAIIMYGIGAQAERLATLVPHTAHATTQLSHQFGWLFIVAHLLLAYSQGGGTYTGLEAVSNNVNTLAEPRIRTGKWTMFYMALSLAFTAGGILLLYQLWGVSKVHGETLNATVFRAIFGSWQVAGWEIGAMMLIIVLALEAGLLLVAANTGFLGGPAVLSNMAVDRWVPHQFSSLSSRLVTQNGVLMMGIAALVILFWSRGNVALLVILYSINVFLTFSLSLFGLCVYWWRNRAFEQQWLWRFLLSASGLALTSSILLVLVTQKFSAGGWVTVVITGLVIIACLLIRRHYDATREQLLKVDELFPIVPATPLDDAPKLDPAAPTAVFFVNRSRGTGMHSLLWVQRLFPGHFKNFVFLSVGEVDSKSYGGLSAIDNLKSDVEQTLRRFVDFCHANGMAATSFHSYGTDPAEELTALAEKVSKQFSNVVFFASKLIFEHDNWITGWLHNQTATTMQRRLHLRGLQMVILPMKINASGAS